MSSDDSQGTAGGASGKLSNPEPPKGGTTYAERAAIEATEKALINLRPYQWEVFEDRVSGVLILHWSRQIGKSFTLAAWAVDRLITRPGRLVTVLSNSKDNGGEFAKKCEEIANLLGQAVQLEDLSEDITYEAMRFEVRITVKGKVGRIKVLAANPRTARGFSGDLILDEFAFHENAAAIWDAAEPILSSNPDFLCRIASTGNGKHNHFYRLRTGGQYKCSVIPRSEAWRQGVKIYSLGARPAVEATGEPAKAGTTYGGARRSITPEEARAEASDKASYDQNYECAFSDENMTLLTHALIARAEDPTCGIICEGDWTPAAMAMLHRAIGNLYVGLDIGREQDWTVVPVGEEVEGLLKVRALLRMRGMRLPEQQARLEPIFKLPKFRMCCADMTGLGLGLVEYAQEKFGRGRIVGVNFAQTVPMTRRIALEGRKGETVRVTEAMATELLQVHEDGRIRYPVDATLRDDLRKPERVTSPGGRVSIAASRDGAGHADHFWGLALMVKARGEMGGTLVYAGVNPRRDEPLNHRGTETQRIVTRGGGVLV